MLSKIKNLKGYSLNALDDLDGKIGKVKEFYFDDRFWAIRYLVANTGSWLTGRQVLISPYALIAIFKEAKSIEVALTKDQIKNSPSLDTDKPVSRQFEDDYYQYYGWPVYWAGPHRWGDYPYIERDQGQWKKSNQTEKAWDPHLRSSNEVNSYCIHASDGEIGHVEDFVLDDKDWAIRYLIINTGTWWPGNKVLISTQWIERVSWDQSKVFVNLSRETIKHSPDYTDELLLSRDYEIGLHGHYNRKGYWVDELVSS